MKHLSLFLVVFLVLLAAPRPAHALFCQGASAIEAGAELCDDNERFAWAAETCRNDYLKAVQAERSGLDKLLKGAAAGAGTQGAAQNVSAATYETTLGRLDALIARGLATELEQKGYIAHFLPPFHWPAELGPKPPKDDPELWKTYDHEFCFGEHRETIDHMVQDVDKAVAQLRKARQETADFKGTALGRQNNLGGGGAAPAVANTHGTSAAGAASGASPAGQSDITGVKQDKAKQGQ